MDSSADTFDDIPTSALWAAVAIAVLIVAAMITWVVVETRHDGAKALKTARAETIPAAESWALDGAEVTIDQDRIRVEQVNGEVQRYDSSFRLVHAVKDHYDLGYNDCTLHGKVRVCSEEHKSYTSVVFERAADVS